MSETLSRNAPSTLVTKQYYAVKMDASLGIVIGTAGAAHGILQNDPAANEIATVQLTGISYAILNGVDDEGAIAEGDPLASDSAGMLIKQTTDNAGVIGYALEACTTSGTKHRVMLTGTARY